MREEAWFKMLILSAVFHFLVLGAFSIPIKKGIRKIDLSSSYSVSLVGDISSISGTQKAMSAQETKTLPEKSGPQVIARKPVPYRPKPVLVRKDQHLVSLSKKRIHANERSERAPTKAEISRLETRLNEIKQRTQYLDVTQTKTAASAGRVGGTSPGTPFSSEGKGSQLDPVTQKYWMDVGDRIRAAWGVPGPSFKKLETLVTIKVRKDGRVVDISMDKRSGNRVYDESILRAVRAVDPLPPIPSSLNVETIELSYRFMPEEVM